MMKLRTVIFDLDGTIADTLAWASTAQPAALEALHPDWLFRSVADLKAWMSQIPLL